MENLAPFAAIVLAAVAAEKTNHLTALAAFVFFAARAFHAVVYTLGIPVLRTLAFQTGWAAQIAIALVALGLI